MSGINELLILKQDSFYHNLTEEELLRVQDYNFDHPGKFNCKGYSLLTASFLLSKCFRILTFKSFTSYFTSKLSDLNMKVLKKFQS